MKNIGSNSLWKLYTKIFIGFLGAGITSINPCFAQSNSNIVPDNTLGTEASRINNNINVNDIPSTLIEGGAERGQNLFHSLQELNVSEGRGAYFIVPNDAIQNVLTRVTGNNLSEILGTLGIRQRDGSNFVRNQANLFLINPNGIIFGENATLDVNGSFVGTTANAIKFGEQGFFSATNPQAPPLLTVNPDALLFNQINQNAAIQNSSFASTGVRDPAGFNVFGLRVPDGKSLLLLGGDVSMDGGELNAYGGRVELGGLAAPGTVALDINGDDFQLGFPENVTRGDVSLTNNANVEMFTGGSIAVNARNLNILDSAIVSRVISGGVDSKAGNIEINTTDTTTIDGTTATNFSGIASGLVGSSGSAGDITIKTGSLDVINGVIGSLTNGEGNAGNVTIIAKDKVSLTNGGITSLVASSDRGNGADVSIQAREISLAESAIITNSLGKGSSGNIKIKADDSVFLSGGSVISSETFGQGNAGSIDIEAGGLVSFDGVGRNNRVSRVSSQVNPLIVPAPEFTGERIGGDINIKTGSLLMRDANLETSTFGIGDAGNVTVNAFDAVSLTNGNIFSTVGAGGVGKGGNITIDSKTLNLGSGAELQASTSGIGNAGNVKVTATDTVSLIDANILSTVEAGGEGQGGNIDINAATLSLTDSAQLITITREASDQPPGKGNAGNVNVKVTVLVDIAGEKNEIPSGIFSYVDTGRVGNGGNITIDSGSFSLRDGARLRASTYGIGNAGNVQVTTTDAVSLAGNALILSTVEAGGVGQGGDIDINAVTLSLTDGAQLLTLTRGASDTDTQPAGQGDAGNVQVKVSGAVDIAGEKNGFYSGIYSVADTGTVGDAGNITIDSGSFSLRDGALINARTKTDGQGGDVIVNTDIFEAFNGGQLIAITSGNGSAGKITVNASEKTTISGSDPNYDNRLAQLPDYVAIIGANSGLFVNSSGLGNTGNIEINSPEITLDNLGK
ncbi:filamentous hemagglutinin N-terminal domain-containing protein, partial [Calothrix sp. CCY 0018]|uniref:two-partner secretion domain-containing protein n=1 Tax=Calothrix sp. CCY 0018 TaxID=3103864 RepID=UPI0039C5D512